MSLFIASNVRTVGLDLIMSDRGLSSPIAVISSLNLRSLLDGEFKFEYLSEALIDGFERVGQCPGHHRHSVHHPIHYVCVIIQEICQLPSASVSMVLQPRNTNC